MATIETREVIFLDMLSKDSVSVLKKTVTSTELGYLDGATSTIQTQLNNKTEYKIGTIPTKHERIR